MWEDWEALENIRRGRIIKHIPTGCVFAVECQGRGFEDWEARLEEGPEVADIEEIGREANWLFHGGGAVAVASSLCEAPFVTGWPRGSIEL